MLAQKVGDLLRRRNYFTSSIYTHNLFPPKSSRTEAPPREILKMTLTSSEINNIYVIDNFLTEEECRAWKKYSSRKGFSRCCKPKDEEENEPGRSYGVLEIHNGSVASRLWQRLKAFVPPNSEFFEEETGCRGGIRIYKFVEGDGVGWTKAEITHTAMKLERAKVAVIIFLNDDFEGGETLLNDNSILGWKGIDAQRGRCVFFSQGGSGVWSKEMYVTKRAKYVMHTEITYRLKHLKISSPKTNERYKRLRGGEALSDIPVKRKRLTEYNHETELKE